MGHGKTDSSVTRTLGGGSQLSKNTSNAHHNQCILLPYEVLAEHRRSESQIVLLQFLSYETAVLATAASVRVGRPHEMRPGLQIDCGCEAVRWVRSRPS